MNHEKGTGTLLEVDMPMGCDVFRLAVLSQASLIPWLSL